MANQAEHTAMRRAIELSTRATWTTPPNPDVGCVILDAAGEIAGEGWHERPGSPHAEIVALRAAGERARGGTAVVTLEPCNHQGRTGPCSNALLDAGVARVVYAVADPNPTAAGGAAHLREHGIDVESGLLADEAAAANARWLTPFRSTRPFVVWKYAATLDGRSAAADGSSRWITGAAARADVHRLRAAVDTIIAGAGTVIVDDPQLTARDGDAELPYQDQPLRVVVDSSGRTPEHARVRDESAPTWIATADEVGATPDGRVDLPKLVAALYERGARYVLLEGGPTLAGAFFAAGLVDQVVAYIAPALLGAGPNALVGAGVTSIDGAIRLDTQDVATIGGDIRIIATPRPSKE
ncbi:bifunctional diaminohydroxyphosphoribosylaminopyrimidine deaminase/5-amino-6-(5-phosphoribosylamino)uracil reductase RibD [Phytoactinopolyspora halotolerans]|uniref:Riboflavin biosynthesis protein RibD n=1 Tax=Phytoactinopolyspora halotolerans TaxID=1981512 RepID=A0A6L9SA31_9ACTN|nr:bifunctional diaminohydroxyphosphoribosylaminopyrimidine deaminase/5-amino-6-(5-phosphoribosylamino)uracil reductase RibD [Phytoactinopolyspora halotolerans]NEE02106.1 bifunctional diaminohydroxyphosphoribosylaminopyrimidine deaminase/5-amino-6-(5-phosphoribosylamino)uracil reductase RibD [Phytoactinopolyspora halotolerans]